MLALMMEAVAVTYAAVDEKVPRHVFRYVERELYDYPVNRELVIDYLRRRDALLNKGRQWPENDAVREEGEPGDPTFDATVQLLMLERSAQRAMSYVTAIDSVMKTLNEEQRRFVKRKYWDDNLTNEALAREMCMSKERYYRMREEIIRKFALRFGLL